MKARILSPWAGTGSDDNPNRPLLEAVLAGRPGWSWTDVTAQPSENLQPDPNLYVLELTCDAPTLAAIEADARFHIVHKDSDKKELPSTARGNAMRQYLRNSGMSNQEARDLVKDTMTLEEIDGALRGWLRDRPKKVTVEPKPKADAEEGVPMVTIFGKRIPFCAKWTWEHVALVRRLYHAFQKS